MEERLGRFNQYLAGPLVRTVLHCDTNTGPCHETLYERLAISIVKFLGTRREDNARGRDK